VVELVQGMAARDLDLIQEMGPVVRDLSGPMSWKGISNRHPKGSDSCPNLRLYR
jgi:hypothetical protein